jgi:hypothetical protein
LSINFSAAHSFIRARAPVNIIFFSTDNALPLPHSARRLSAGALLRAFAALTCAALKGYNE